jgi:hypothetical protein
MHGGTRQLRTPTLDEQAAQFVERSVVLLSDESAHERLVLGRELRLGAAAWLGRDALACTMAPKQFNDEITRHVERSGDLRLRDALLKNCVEDLLTKVERVRFHPEPLDRYELSGADSTPLISLPELPAIQREPL